MSATALRRLRLQYGAFLLREIQRRNNPRRPVNWAAIEELCDRFERVMASIDVDPLLWEGDYA